MCQLLAINSQQRFDITPLLADFFKRGGQTDIHADGWGLAAFDHQGELSLAKLNAAAAQCETARALLKQTDYQSHAMAHIRKATYGQSAISNTQPFHRSLWGQDWSFAHNGDLHDYLPALPPTFRPKGETDSEKAFCQLLTSLQQAFELFHPKLDVLLAFLKQTSDEIAQHGSFNYLLSNNQYLIAYASTELYWTDIYRPQVPLSLVDSRRQLRSLTRQHNNKVVLVATKPLLKGEVWYPMGRGEIRLFAQGRLIKAIAADEQSESRQAAALSFF